MLALGTIGFWIFTIILTGIIWTLLEVDKPGWATFSMIVALTAFSFLGDFSIIDLVRNEPLKFVGLMGGYVIAGVLWSIAKWYFHVSSQARKYTEMKSNWMEICEIPPKTIINDQQRKDFFSANYGAVTISTRPKAKRNKGRILSWMMYWPWSASWTIINDPVVRLFKEIYAKLSTVFDKISAHAYKGIDD